jgi:hypothetical protein
MRYRAAWILALVLAAAGPGTAEEGQAPADPKGGARDVTVRLKDGSTLLGTITDEDADPLHVVTTAGVEVKVPRATIERIESGHVTLGRLAPEPVADDSRLFLAPTGRPLRKGEGYFSDHWLLFPGMAYGVTDNFTLAGGVSVIPGLGLGEQVAYFTPKLGARIGHGVSASVGGLLLTGGDGEANARVGYVVGTVDTSPTGSLTAGFGFGRSADDDTETRPIVMIGGSARLSKHAAFLTENWLILGHGFDISEQPLSLGFRLYGDHLTVDIGMVVVLEYLKDGLPIPWLSFSYHFGGQPLASRR